MKFLLELASEEIPARMQAAAAEQLRSRFIEGLKAAGLAHGNVIADATPRRLWLIADDIAAASAAASEERKGPAANAPDAAIAGFLRGVGLTRDALEERETPKGVVLFAHIQREGRGAETILAELVPAIVSDFQWPKSMRWGSGTARWVRPLTGIVALLDGKIVPCAAHGINAGRTTRGHRILGGEVVIENAESYAAQMRASFVIVASAERRAAIEAAAATAASALTVIPDPGLVAENAGLTEWPVPMLGSFDPAFLAVPREIIQLTMRTNQKYFACADASGALAPNFVCVANLPGSDGGKAIVAGNERVLSARLADAKFFWDQDVKAGLGSFVPKLADIVFHEKLGTVADKVERVARLARWLVESGAIGAPAPTSNLADLAERAARLCKADLVSATVGEFPEVEGIAGAYLARLAGEDPQVANAIRDHYGNGVGTTEPAALAVALADKLDTVISFFKIGEKPTGSRDPFALRRAGLGAMFLILSTQMPLDLNDIAPRDVIEFLIDRWKFQNREAGGRPDLIDAVVAVTMDGNLTRLGARMRALEVFIGTDDSVDLQAGVKRAANILRIEEAKGETFAPESDAALFAEPAEIALSAALATAAPIMAAAVEREDFTVAMTTLAGLRPAVDAFFNTVVVNSLNPAIRANRLGLLAQLRDAAYSVADFSKIEG